LAGDGPSIAGSVIGGSVTYRIVGSITVGARVLQFPVPPEKRFQQIMELLGFDYVEPEDPRENWSFHPDAPYWQRKLTEYLEEHPE